ncbi:thioesterase II family protein [Acanthopleuribacter pedis]|uniref:Thioesterase n=1 Tax=Acanthopleuribacter pedis TaxID=442870 RepID=A0A8J7QEC7_9BACT|nr:alpha/beta fold hydrolase [Acanthopleuribacter pedis]MBO1322674.1 thioesterase [Acanthopleuribacter pedis]
MTTFRTPWLRCFAPHTNPKKRLFAFHHGGGSAVFVKNWHTFLGEDVEVVGVQLPGRQERMREKPITQVEALVQPLAQALQPYTDLPFYLFGHSLGAMVSFELARYLCDFTSAQPQALIVSGRHAPQVKSVFPKIARLDDQAFLEGVKNYDGLPAEILAHKELLQLILPSLRADFALSETYFYQPAPPLPHPIAAIGGNADRSVPVANLEAWQKQTRGGFSMQLIDGGHFYFEEQPDAFFTALKQVLDGAS